MGDWQGFALLDAFVSAALGLICISAALEGAMFERLSMPVRAALLVAGLLMAIPEELTNYAGYAIAGSMWLYYWTKQKKAKKTAQ